MNITRLLDFEYKDDGLHLTVIVTKFEGATTRFTVSSMNSKDKTNPKPFVESFTSEKDAVSAGEFYRTDFKRLIYSNITKDFAYHV